MLFAVICTDKPHALDLRVSTRADHLAYLEKLGDAVKGAGPFLDAKGAPMGSMILIEAATALEVEAMAAQDPYALAGLFAQVDIRPWNWLIKKPELL